MHFLKTAEQLPHSPEFFPDTISLTATFWLFSGWTVGRMGQGQRKRERDLEQETEKSPLAAYEF